MALAYVPPGVQVEELFSPSVNPLLSVSASVCLVGLARGYELGVGQVTFAANSDPDTVNDGTLTAPTGTIFQRVDSDNVFDAVTNPLDPEAGSGTGFTGFIEGTDFTTTVAADKKTVTISPVEGSTLDTDGGTLRFVYRFVAENYFDAVRLDTSAGVEARFGPAFNENGIVTPLSAAASLAFENGAASVVVQPLFHVVSGAPTQPTSTQAADNDVWAETLVHLRDIEDINIIVPIVGASDANVSDAEALTIFEAVQSHIVHQQQQGQYIVGVFGEDSSGSTNDATLATIRNHAGILRDRSPDLAEQLVMVSPSRFTRVLPANNNRSITVGGQYVAAAVAGMIAGRPVSAPLTRKQMSGFSSVSYPGHDKAAKDADAAAGLLVVEQKGLAVQVRHAVTLDNTSTARRELSVVRAKHRMIESLRDTIDTQIIGQVPADGQAPLVVKNAVIGVLEDLRQRREIVDYQGVQARILSNDPTTVECRFSYRPAFPLNYVNITFSLDLTGGNITTTFGNLAP